MEGWMKCLGLVGGGYLLAINLVGFCAMGLDKHRAKKGQWRIPEGRLFLYALLGGSVGSLAGMQIFRHKTKHWYFRYGMPLILVIQILLAAVIIWIMGR